MTDLKTRLDAIVAEIELGMNCTLLVKRDPSEFVGDHEVYGRFFLQIECLRPDALTGEMGVGHGGKWTISPWMTENEIIQAAFGLYKSYWEHEAREMFRWRGRQVFGPHISTQALWEVANRTESRPDLPES